MSRAKLALSHWYCLHRLTGVSALNTGLAIAIAAIVSYPAQAAVLSAWTFNPNTQQLEVTLPQAVIPSYFLLAEPARLILDIPNTQVGDVVMERTYLGPVRNIRVAQYDANATRIVMELAPGTVLDPRQAQLQRIELRGQTRWLLQPLIADSAEAASAATPAADAASGFDQNAPGQSLAAANTNGVRLSADSLLTPWEETNLSNLPSTLSTETLPPTSEPSALVSVPPLEDDFAADIPGSSAVASTPASPQPPTVRSETEPIPIPIFPPFLDGADASSPIPTSLPSDIAIPSPSSVSETPSLPGVEAPLPPSTPDAIPFGQPLPTFPVDYTSTLPSQPIPIPVSPPLSQEVYPPDGDGLMIPAGMMLSLQYPNSQPLELGEGPPRQEVLILSQDLRAAQTGILIAPAGTQVVGRFEMAESGQKFIVQAISIQGQNLPLVAESEVLDGDRQVSGNRVLLNSGIGGAALAILSGFTGIGLLAGAAVAAGTTYAITPQTVIIEPKQIITVQVRENLPLPEGGFADSPIDLSYSTK